MAADGKEAHPDDSILLAYIRQQPLGNSWPNIDLHLTQCSACTKRVRKLQEISISLDAGLLPSQDMLPQSQLERNWDWLESREVAQHLYQRRKHERLREDQLLGMALLTHLPQLLLAVLLYVRQLSLTKMLPAVVQNIRYQSVETYRPGLRAKNPIQVASLVIVLALVLVLAALFVFAEVKHPFTPYQPVNVTRTVGPAVNATIVAHATATMAASLSGGKTTAGVAKPTISLCLTKADKNQHRMRICGVNFKPGDRVEIVIEIAGSMPRPLHNSVPVNATGKFEDTWSLNGCRSVPVAIFAWDVEHPAIVSQVLQNIQYDGCPPQRILTAGMRQH